MAAEKDVEKRKKRKPEVDGKKVIQNKKKEKQLKENQQNEKKPKEKQQKEKKTSVSVTKREKNVTENKNKIKKASNYKTKNKTNSTKSKNTKTNNKSNNTNVNSNNTNVWDTLGIPDIKDAVKRTTDTEGFKWIVFLASAAGLFIFLIILYIAGRTFVKHYKVEQVYVEGSTHYTKQEIEDMVMEGPLGDNSIYLGFKYKDKAIENVPFVQRMDVEVLDANSIRIRVYEKAVAGYFEHLGRYVYFDKDGIVIETSEKETKGIPLVTGLSFNYVVMYEPLPIEKKEVFEDILDITQLLNKYEILADKIYFDKDNRKTLYFGNARVSLGTNDNIDEKILKLKYILPKLEGLSGVLRMDNYTEGVTNITFEEDKK